MFFKIMRDKKGFTMIEILIVVIVLGILTAFAVPLFAANLEKQRIKDCKNQQTIISATVEQAMYGMLDNGRRQEKIDFSKVQSDHKETYNGKECFVLIKSQDLPGKIAFNLSDLRGGYRDINNVPDYNDGCENGNYLKKKKLANNEFYKYLANAEIPVCPFADFDNNDKTDDYRYYIFDDGSVMCSCPKCGDN